MGKVTVIFVAAVMGFGLCSAQADIITLSDFGSDSTPAECLDATVEFSVVESTLTIVVSNLTDGPDGGQDTGFDIMSIYFNATENVADLMLTSPASGWALYPWSNYTKANGFGQFDFALIGSVGSEPAHVDGESSETFTLTVTGTGVSASDFYTDLSVIPPGKMPMLVAAKFVNGPGDDSAFGATEVPEPVTVALLGLGGLVLICGRRK